MKQRRILAALILVVIASSATAFGESDPGLPDSVVYVVSTSNLQHTLRVAVLNEGFEHVSSRVYLQWLVPDRDAVSGTRILVTSRLIEEVSGGQFSVGQPTVERHGDAFRVVLSATQVYTLDEETFTFIAEDPGAYKAAK